MRIARPNIAGSLRIVRASSLKRFAYAATARVSSLLASHVLLFLFCIFRFPCFRVLLFPSRPCILINRQRHVKRFRENFNPLWDKGLRRISQILCVGCHHFLIGQCWSAHAIFDINAFLSVTPQPQSLCVQYPKFSLTAL